MALSDENLLIQNNKSNFYYSFFFLPKEKRDAINTIYSFCDITDNIVDSSENSNVKRMKLTEWRDELYKSRDGISMFSIQNETGRIMKKYSIPFEYLLSLIEGMEMDLNNKKYDTFEELYKYCYNVAAIVGLISAKIFGYKNRIMEEYAVDLGIALQLTNIIRDVKEDAIMGRIYLPKDEMDRFNVNPNDLCEFRYSTGLNQLMEFQYERAMRYYRNSDEKLIKDEKHNFLAARIMRNIYFDILRKIKENGFRIFEDRVRLSRITKLFIALKTIFK